ncbi:MAG: hypothetical protein AB1758_37490 [Candidatus Eremiobacterota bacterium]
MVVNNFFSPNPGFAPGGCCPPCPSPVPQQQGADPMMMGMMLGALFMLATLMQSMFSSSPFSPLFGGANPLGGGLMAGGLPGAGLALPQLPAPPPAPPARGK